MFRAAVRILRAAKNQHFKHSIQDNKYSVCERSHTGLKQVAFFSGQTVLGWLTYSGKVYLFCCLGNYGNTDLSAGKDNSSLKTVCQDHEIWFKSVFQIILY